MRTVYVVHSAKVDYDDQCYSIDENGHTVKAYADKAKAEAECFIHNSVAISEIIDEGNFYQYYESQELSDESREKLATVGVSFDRNNMIFPDEPEEGYPDELIQALIDVGFRFYYVAPLQIDD